MLESRAKGGWSSRAPCALEHCLAERWRTRQRPDVWQVATVVTAARHDNRLHWSWLRDRRISNWCSLILTRRLTPRATGWTSFVCGGVLCNIFLPRRKWCVQSIILWVLRCGHCIHLFVRESHEANITGRVLFQQLFWATKSCKTVCIAVLNSWARRLLQTLQPKIAVDCAKPVSLDIWRAER